MLAAHLRYAAFALVVLTPALSAAQKPPPAAPASEDPQSAARSRAQDGLKLFGADRWTEALAAFREADALFHAPSVAIYIARCQRKLGKLFDARGSYERLLAEDLPADAPAPFVAAHVEAGKELELIRQHMPALRVVVTGAPPGDAQVTVNGAPFGDETREVDPGTYTIVVRSRSGATVTQTLALEEGARKAMTIDVGPDKGVNKGGGRNWLLPGIAFGVGGVGLVVGAVAGSLALSQAADIKKVCTPSVPCPQESSAASAAQTKAWVANAGFFVLIAGGVTGAVLLLTHASPGAQRAVKSAVGPEGLTLRF
jgi:hypothetical protein